MGNYWDYRLDLHYSVQYNLDWHFLSKSMFPKIGLASTNLNWQFEGKWGRNRRGLFWIIVRSKSTCLSLYYLAWKECFWEGFKLHLTNSVCLGFFSFYYFLELQYLVVLALLCSIYFLRILIKYYLIKSIQIYFFI